PDLLPERAAARADHVAEPVAERAVPAAAFAAVLPDLPRRGPTLGQEEHALMQKQAPSFGRIAAMVIFALSCFGILVFLWVSFGGALPLQPKKYELTASFPEATTLAENADVRISGVPVGKVESKSLSGNTTKAVLAIDSRYAPIPADTHAILRQKTLLGETYVELTP